MKRTLAILVAVSSLAAPVLAQSDGRRGHPGGGDQATSGGGQGSGGGAQTSGGGGSGQTASAPSSGDSGGSQGRAVPRSGRSESGSGSDSGQTRSGATARRGGDDTNARGNGSSERSAVNRPGARPREGHSVQGEAVRRRPGSGSGGGTTVIVPPYYYPWGWGGFGLGAYYGGFYDPWWDDPGYGYGYGGGYATGGYDYDGALRIKVKPREAEVYVDGYFAGEVDDYDGVFQKLRLESGPHRIELREEGYEPLFFDIRIQPDRTVTYEGELQKLP